MIAEPDSHSSPWIHVQTTVEHLKDARQIARGLVETRLAACVQIQAEIESIYRWNGQIEQGREWSLVAKSHVRLWSDLATWIDENHPYECPQLIALPLVRVVPSFESWLNDQLLD